MKFAVKSALAAFALVAVAACGTSKSKKDDVAAPQPTPAPSAEPTPEPTPAPSAEPTPSPSPTAAADLTDDQALALTGQYCMGCHSTANHKKNVVLDTLDGAVAAADRSAAELGAGKMPPARATQPDADTKAKLIQWFNSKHQ
jgi:hypothetical protein